MSAFDWNDARFVLSAMRNGSALAAASDLNVSQPTVARRVAAFEEALGLVLFERSRTGVRLTDQAETLRPFLEALETAALNLESAARAEDRRVAGVLRVTTNEITANFALAPALREFQAQYPKVRVELIVDDRNLDLASGQADVAIRGGLRLEGAETAMRGGLRPTEAGLVSRRLNTTPATVFGSREYFARYGRPGALDDLERGHVVLTCEWPHTIFDEIIRAGAPKTQFAYRSSSASTMVVNAKHGLGLVVLPENVFLDDPELEVCFALPGVAIDAWLVTHERLRHVPRVRAFLDFAAAFQAARSRRLARGT